MHGGQRHRIQASVNDTASLSAAQKDHYVLPSQLCVGLHVHLDLSWTEHPFTFSSFQLKTQDQIDAILALKLARVRYSPDKSSSQPLPVTPAKAAAPAAGLSTAVASGGAAVLKSELVARLNEHVARMRTCESALTSSARSVKNIAKNVFARPAEAVKEASQLIGLICRQMPATSEIAIHLMSDKLGGEEVYHHSLNVALLSMMLGRELRLTEAQMEAVGMGALFHDVGKMDVDPKVAKKTDTLSRHEAALLKTHVSLGVDVIKRLVGVSAETGLIIAQHHEFVDGTGYPKHLKDAQISPLAKVVSVVNEFDNLCNPPNAAKALTPHEALSLLYGQQRSRFDAKVIATFVRCMGIYPPGTLVVLSNGALGMVVSVNSSRPLKPTVLVFDPSVKRSEALVVELEKEPEVSVLKTMRPAQLSTDAMSYLAPRRRTTYYFDAQPGKA